MISVNLCGINGKSAGSLGGPDCWICVRKVLENTVISDPTHKVTLNLQMFFYANVEPGDCFEMKQTSRINAFQILDI